MTEVGELRSQVRHWRRGRATTTLWEVAQDAYVVLFSGVVLGAMTVSVLVNLGRMTRAACTTDGCLQAQVVLPWITAGLAIGLALALAQLFGPLFLTPAEASWLATAPVSRARLLGPRLIVTWLAGFLGAGLVAASAFTVAGDLSIWVPAIGTAFAAVLAISLAGLDQVRRQVVAVVAGGLLWLTLWGLLLALALAVVPTGVSVPLWPIAVAVAVLMLAAVVALSRRAGSARIVDLAPGGSLTPGLSGALATFDLALVYDLLVGHRWRRRGSVRPHRVRQRGYAALISADLIRLRRRPQPAVVVAAVVVTGYAAASAGAGRLTFVALVLAGFLAGLPLLVGLRVFARAPSLVRMMPFRYRSILVAASVVPGVLLLLFGLAAAPALRQAMPLGWGEAAVMGAAAGLAAFVSAFRWVTGKPPNYTRPLVSTPAGAVPTTLYGSVFRGFDIAVLTCLPVLVSPSLPAAAISIALSLVVFSALTSEPPR